MMPTIKHLEQTCFACPSQWEGETTDGKYIYIRYRWGYLSVDVDGKEIFGLHVGSNTGGVMSEKEMLEITGLRYVE